MDSCAELVSITFAICFGIMFGLFGFGLGLIYERDRTNPPSGGHRK